MDNYNLKEEIKKLGMTQKEFAKHIGVSEDTVGKWVRGTISTPNWAKLLIRLLKKEAAFEKIKELIRDEL